MTQNHLIKSSPGSQLQSMYIPPLHPSSNLNSYVSGDVTIDPNAAIASGVLIQANPNSRIVIGAGVCIGMGSILHAHEGTLEVEAGVTLGAGVLVIGKGKIGANSCIGPTTTILNPSIEPGQVIVAGSVIGDKSRQSEVTGEAIAGVASSTPSPPSASSQSQSLPPNSLPTDNSQPTPRTPELTNNNKVYGQAHLDRMLSTMFPHRQALNPPPQDGQ